MSRSSNLISEMTTYVLDNNLWMSTVDIPEFLDNESNQRYQYSIIKGIMQLRDGLLIGEDLYIIDMQYRLWLFNSQYKEGVLTSIRQVKRIHLIRGILVTIDVNHRISRIIRSVDSLDWYKIRYDNACSIVAIINHCDILLLLTLNRELQIGYIDDSCNLIITSHSIMGRIRSVVGPIIIDNDYNVTILGLSYYHINRSITINPYYSAIIDVDYNHDGILSITNGGTLIYQSNLGYVVNLSGILSLTSLFKSFIRLRQNPNSLSFIKDCCDSIWILQLNIFDVSRSSLLRLYSES